jgi:hypothetical protein
MTKGEQLPTSEQTPPAPPQDETPSHPWIGPSPEAKAAAEPAKEAVKEAIREIQTPEQAAKVADEPPQLPVSRKRRPR